MGDCTPPGPPGSPPDHVFNWGGNGDLSFGFSPPERRPIPPQPRPPDYGQGREDGPVQAVNWGRDFDLSFGFSPPERRPVYAPQLQQIEYSFSPPRAAGYAQPGPSGFGTYSPQPGPSGFQRSSPQPGPSGGYRLGSGSPCPEYEDIEWGEAITSSPRSPRARRRIQYDSEEDYGPMNDSPPMVLQSPPRPRPPMPVFEPVPLGNRLPPEERDALHAEIEAMIARGNALRAAQIQYGVLNREYFDDAWWDHTPEVSWRSAAIDGVLEDRAQYQQNICPSRRSQADYEEDYMYRISSDFGSYFDRPSNDPSSPFGYSPMTSYATCPETSFSLNSSYATCPGMDDSFDVEDDFEDAAESF